MRVISDFNDYYDNAMAHGQDMSVVYQRKTIEYDKLDKAPSVIKTLHKDVYGESKVEGSRYWWVDRELPIKLFGKPDHFYLTQGNIVFCGKVYRYIALKRDVIEMSPTASKHYFYDCESMLAFCDANKLKIDEPTSRWNKTSTRQRIAKRFDKKCEVDQNWMIENKVICACVKKNQVTINPRLKDKQFFKVFDSYSAYQDLDMWISGTLAYPQNAMVELDDKSMIAKHGFDKWSFRKQPEGFKG